MQHDDNWEESFFAELGSASHSLDQDDQENPDDGEQFDVEPPPPKIIRFQDAISSLEDVQSFLDYKGFSEEATKITSSMNTLTYLHCQSLNSARQMTLKEYFHSI